MPRQCRHEKTVLLQTPMPKGYGFLQKGNAYRTGLCRRKTLQANKSLYIVKDGSKVLGLRAPKWILSQVFAQDRDTKEHRKQTLLGRDVTAKHDFEAAIVAQFPQIPPKEAMAVTERAMKKRSRRVGRTGKLSLQAKARLAVVAHVRHCHTPYDHIVQSSGREEARIQVYDTIKTVLKGWGDCQPSSRPRSNRSATKPSKANASRKAEPKSSRKDDQVVIISDDEIDDEEEDEDDDSLNLFLDDDPSEHDSDHDDDDDASDHDSWSGIEDSEQDDQVITIESDSDT